METNVWTGSNGGVMGSAMYQGLVAGGSATAQ